MFFKSSLSFPEDSAPQGWLAARSVLSVFCAGVLISATMVRPLEVMAQTREEAVTMAREGGLRGGPWFQNHHRFR